MLHLNSRIKASIRPFLLHLALSVAIVAGVAVVVFGIWYPYPYRDLMGGLHLFAIVAMVDVVCGPAMTAVLFNPKKSKRELRLDLSMVVLIQLAALMYGIYTVAMARPVLLVFEVDRMVAVSAAQIDQSKLQLAPENLQSLSWTGPKVIGVRQPRDAEDRLDALNYSLQGIEPSVRPNWWQEYDLNRDDVKKRMRPLIDLLKKSPSLQREIKNILRSCQSDTDQLYYLPLVSQKYLDEWVVLLNDQADIICYAPVGGFE